MSFAKVVPLVGTGCLAILALASSAAAHPGHGAHGFAEGWRHPLFGLDHLLAMVAVGLLAVRFGGGALWAMPAAFLGGMLSGGGLGLAGMHLPGVEWGILASVIVMGLLIAASAATYRGGLLIVAAFAVFHGFAHAVEMSPDASAAAYMLGFVLSTAVLHAGGILAGLLMMHGASRAALRVCGGLIAVAGLMLAFGAA